MSHCDVLVRGIEGHVISVGEFSVESYRKKGKDLYMSRGKHELSM